jgi:exopolysaccharide biosynthesis polyprenyl glycosylphosphotransferase
MNDLKRKDWPNRLLLFLDIGCMIVSFLLATWVRYGGITHEWMNNLYGWTFIILISLYIAIYYIYDTNYMLFQRGFFDELIVIIKNNLLLMVTSTVVLFILKEGSSLSRLFFFCFFILNICFTYIVRQYYKVLLLAYYKTSSSSKKIMIITTFDQAREVLRRMRSEEIWEYEVTNLTIIDQNIIGQNIDGIEVKANLDNMFEVAKEQVLDGVFLHIPSDLSLQFDIENTIVKFENMGVTVNLSIYTFGLNIHEKIVQEMGGYHVLTFSSKIFSESQLHLKRMLDIIGGLVGCFLTAIAIIFIAPAILIESPGPIIFSQIRVGKNGRRFRIYKFRSMYMDAEERQKGLLKENEMSGLMFKMNNDPRITKVGKFIRKTSIDELPQFYNILRGDMSLVGTRPPTVTEFLQYEGRHKRRLALRSGLTGLWQVSGRSDITDFEEVVKLDLEYIDNWSLMMDIRILIKTIWVVVFDKGSY